MKSEVNDNDPNDDFIGIEFLLAQGHWSGGEECLIRLAGQLYRPSAYPALLHECFWHLDRGNLEAALFAIRWRYGQDGL